MKIELVGGPRCGDVVDVKFLNFETVVSVPASDPARYTRRDHPWMDSGLKGGCYGEKGYRFYDYAKVGE